MYRLTWQSYDGHTQTSTEHSLQGTAEDVLSIYWCIDHILGRMLNLWIYTPVGLPIKAEELHLQLEHAKLAAAKVEAL